MPVHICIKGPKATCRTPLSRGLIPFKGSMMHKAYLSRMSNCSKMPLSSSPKLSLFTSEQADPPPRLLLELLVCWTDSSSARWHCRPFRCEWPLLPGSSCSFDSLPCSCSCAAAAGRLESNGLQRTPWLSQ